MSKVYERIDDRLREFIHRQSVFFVATAPRGSGHINISPKGVAGTFAVLDDLTVAYADLTGSGAETIAHLRDDGRITVMFCAFQGPPNVVRLHGRGRVVTLYDEEFPELQACFAETPGIRAVVVVDVERVADSCGWGVPVLTEPSERDLLQPFLTRKGAAGHVAYRRSKNLVSIDGLPAFDYDPPVSDDAD